MCGIIVGSLFTFPRLSLPLGSIDVQIQNENP